MRERTTTTGAENRNGSEGIRRRTVLKGAIAGATGVALGATAGAASTRQNDLPNEIRLESETKTVRYRIAVSGSIAFGPEAGENDQIEDGTATGLIDDVNAPDDYRFSGRITEFALTEGEAAVFVNGERVDDPVGLPDRPDRSGFALEQGEECVPLTPLSGDAPVEELYEYAYPTDRFEGPTGVDGTTYSSEGTVDLQRDATSVLFLYDGPEGLSLVVVHGYLEGKEDDGGTVSFDVRGLPSDGEWVVRDDYYLNDAGEQAESNVDNWDVGGETATIDWAYQPGRTDGGAFRGLDEEFEVQIDPTFDDAAALADDQDVGPIESWELLSGDRDDPERRSLSLDRPVTIRASGCGADGDATAGETTSALDARIVDVSVADGPYEPGDEVRADVTVENTGDREQTFLVGHSSGDTDRRSDGTPVTVGPDETETVTISWTLDSDVSEGAYEVNVIVWQERERERRST